MAELAWAANLSNRKIVLIVLTSQQWPDVQLHLDKIAATVIAALPGQLCGSGNSYETENQVGLGLPHKTADPLSWKL